MKPIPYIFLLFSVATLLLFISCESESILNDYHVYVIKKDKHSSTDDIRQFDKNKLSFIAIFDNSAIYQNKDTFNQADVNKLYGFTDCASSTHTNSARFAWRWFDNELQIFAYCYKNQQKTSTYITSVKLNEPNTYSITVDYDKYIFQVNHANNVIMERGCTGSSIKFMLYPYFGGDETAPHDIIIMIKELG